MSSKNEVEVRVSKELINKINNLLKLVGYRSKEEYVEAAIRRLLTHHLNLKEALDLNI